MKILLIIMTILNTAQAEIPFELLRFKNNKEIPKIIENSVLLALSHYPELEDTFIKFEFKQNLNGSVMQAQPLISSFFKMRSKRGYRINISSMLKLVHSAVPIHQLPENIMIGWIGHELGHIMDYETRSNAGLIGFGFSYITSSRYRTLGETRADTFAVNHGLGEYIIDTKNFILDHAELPQKYKDKIARLYLSPDSIVEQVKKLEEKKLADQKRKLSD